MLTWRSIVNRVWHYHFGAGIVDSPERLRPHGFAADASGAARLAGAWFRDERRIVEEAASADRDERGVPAVVGTSNAGECEDRCGQPLPVADEPQRLDAESVRDAILAVSGKLDLTMGGPSAEQFFFKDDHSPVYDYSRFDRGQPRELPRSVYRFIVRSVPDPFMERLDCPDASLMTAKRNTTITAIQALALLNNPFMVRQAEHLARARTASSARCRRSRWRWAYRLTLGRRADRQRNANSGDAMLDAYGLDNAVPSDSEQQRISVCRLRGL